MTKIRRGIKSLIRALVPFAIRSEYLILRRRAKNLAESLLSGAAWVSAPPGESVRSDAESSHPVLLFEYRSRIEKSVQEEWREAQKRKRITLSLAAGRLDGVVVEPGRQLSFWRLVGRPDRRAGFPTGLMLVNDRMVEQTAGGLCQISNALHWAALNLGLTVLERHRHSYDLFPDDHRTTPFGSGATVVYNYKDLRFRNDTPVSLMIRLSLDREDLILRVMGSEPLPWEIRVEERDHRFFRDETGRVFRCNRLVSLKRTGESWEESPVAENICEVRYPVSIP